MTFHEVRGRVVAIANTCQVFCNGTVVTIHGVLPESFSPGDLVRLHIDHTHTLVQILERVCPKKQPFSASSDTRHFLQHGQLERLYIRQHCLDAIRTWFRTLGALEVETPAVSLCPGMDVHLDAYNVTDRHEALFGRLITSPEYHMKRVLVGGADRCFQFARCWRAGELGMRHQPEFTMLEWYASWSGLDVMMRDTEAIVRTVADACKTPDRFTVHGQTISLNQPFETLTVREAFSRYAPDLGDAIELATLHEEAYYTAISTRIEPHLGTTHPVFLTEFPSCHASLARVCTHDASVCERTELYIAGIELCNAFHELTDPQEQRRRFLLDQQERARRGLPVFPIDEDFLSSLEEGLAPCAGNALGIDRLIALALGRTEIADVIAFPRRNL
jgi:elongation factor P--(R)-beta-lysine ligase